jgi:hypothetical protein
MQYVRNLQSVDSQKLPLKEPQVLQNLSNQQLEKAFQWLASPVQEPPPQELENLQQVEWFLLSRMLDGLMQEQQNSPLQ